MRKHIKPYNFKPDKELKIPMPTPKKVRKLEKLKQKGLDVSYPRAPWFTDNVESLKQEQIDREKRMAEAEHAELLEQYPARRPYRSGKPRIEKEELAWSFKFP